MSSDRVKGCLSAVLAAAVAVCGAAAPEGLAPDGATVPTHTALQKAYLHLPRPERRAAFADRDYRRRLGSGESRPEPTVLGWQGGEKGTVTVRRKTDGRVFRRFENAESPVTLSGLEVGRDYEWTVETASGSASAAFRTEAETPRLLWDDHVPNLRDLGGYRGLGGRRVRQNRVFRSAGLNSNATRAKLDGAEVRKFDPEGVLDGLRDRFAPRLAELKRASDDFHLMKTVKAELPRRWSVRRLADGLQPLEAAIAFVKALGAGGGEESVEVNGRGEAMLGNVGDGQWALLSATVTAAEAGSFPVEAAADWYWALAVNGELLINRLNGNGRAATDYGYYLTLPLRKGENLVQAIVGSGSQGYFLRVGPETEHRLADIAYWSWRHCDEAVENIKAHPTRKVAGATRIHDDNRDFWLKELGIRSDIDLRSDGECEGMTGSPLGDTVAWFHIPSGSYKGMSEAWGQRQFAKVFRVFLDERNYPIVFHCIAGQDRTGAAAYVLLSLLGVDEEDLWKDWEATGFHNRSPGFVHARLFDELLKVFAAFPGATNTERVENFVKSLGFTDDDIARYRRLMFEPETGERKNQ